MITDLSLSAIETWKLYRGRAECENLIKKLKYEFGPESLVIRDFWAKEAGLTVVVLAYNLMCAFRQAVSRQKAHQPLSMLQNRITAIGEYWWANKEGDQKSTLNIIIARKRRP